MYCFRVRMPVLLELLSGLKYLLQKLGSLRARKTVKEVKYPIFMPMV